MTIPTEADVNAGAPAVFSFLMGYAAGAWERLKSVGGALFVTFANATSLAYGSTATSSTAAALGTTTAYTGGLVVTNVDAAITIWLGSSSGVTAGVGAAYPLAAGASVTLPTGDLAGVFAISASGTPTIAWIGVTA
jgi:hypothetical protein